MMDPYGNQIRALKSGPQSARPPATSAWQGFQNQIGDYEIGGGKYGQSLRSKYSGDDWSQDWEHDDRIRDLEMKRIGAYEKFRMTPGTGNPTTSNVYGTFYESQRPYYDQVYAYDQELNRLNNERRKALGLSQQYYPTYVQ